MNILSKLKFILIFLSLMSNFALKAQNKVSVNGILRDSLQKSNSIPRATISIYALGDTSLVTYGLSDNNGKFNISALSANTNFKMVVSSWQFKTLRRVIFTSSEHLDLGVVSLLPKENQLDEVIIKSETPPVIVRNDTLEFNADSYKTLPTAFVEDLFKKLPGFRVLKDGKIQVNGRDVSRILVEGRDFFGGDQLIATRNLPAYIINKVQVTDDKLVTRRNPDLSSSEIPQVINLTLKKDVKRGAFGKVYAGTGFGEKYEAGGIFNIFRDTTQISILAYDNNVNHTGFSLSDITTIGGFDRSGYQSTVMNENGSFSLDNMDFGAGGSGIQHSSGAGANFNTITNSNLKINGKYFYGRNNSFLKQSINDIQTLGDEQLNSNSFISKNSIIDSHNIGVKLNWEPTPQSALGINSSVNISPINDMEVSNSQTFLASGLPLSDAAIKTQKNGRSTTYNVGSDYYKDFKKIGRSLSLYIGGSKNNNLNDNYNYSSTFNNSDLQSTIIDQSRNVKITESNINVLTSYAEPLVKNLSLVTTFNGIYSDNTNALNTFYANPMNMQYDIAVPSLSGTVHQSGIKTSAKTRLRWSITKNLNFNPGLNFGSISLTNRFTFLNTVKQHYIFFFPYFNFKYKKLTIDYTSSIKEANVQYLQPIIDNTNPLIIQQGNVNLLPSKTHKLTFRVVKQNQAKGYNINITGNGMTINNAVIFKRTVSVDGIQINTPINVSGLWELSMGGGIGKFWNGADQQANINLGFNINYNKNVVEVNDVLSKVNNISFKPTIGGRIDLSDIIELDEYYNLSANKSTYQDTYFTNQTFLTQSSETNLVTRFIKNIVIDAKFRIVSTNQKLDGYKNTLNILDAGTTFLFLKNNRGQLRFSANDLLKSNVGRTTLITANSIRDVQTNAIGRYFLLTMNYNIQSFKGKK